MKIMLFLILILSISCQKQNKDKIKNINSDTSNTQSSIPNKKLSKYYINEDTLLITSDLGDTLKVGKEYFNQIVDSLPELFEKFPPSADELNYTLELKNIDYSCEVCKDGIFMVYSHILKQKNGIEKYKDMRIKLIKIYRNINDIFGSLSGGGTYFGHQYDRILGYAEYTIYLYKGKSYYELNKYDIKLQKLLYIKSLKQIIKDEIKVDNDILRIHKLKKVIFK